eukprot:Pgem_evm1s1549
MIPINHDLRPEDVVSMDPGIRTFMTTYDTNGFCSEWGEANGKEMKNLHGKKGRKKRRNLRKAIERL